MDFNNRKQLQQIAAERIENAPVTRTIAFWFAAVTTGVMLLSTVVSFFAGMQMSQLGGLGNLGARSVLSTIQSVLPLVASLFLTCLTLGFAGTMLRISRGQYASPQGMKIGFSRFWLLMKVTLLQSVLYMAATLISFYLSFAIFLLTPMSDNAIALVAPLASQLPVLTPGASLVIDETMQAQLTAASLPVMALMLVIMVALYIPIFYRYRMVNYLIIDNPGMPALMVMRTSRFLMRKRHFAMFRLDLSMWWYYLAMLIASVVNYLELILAACGISLPMSPNVSYFVMLFAYLILNGLVLFFLRPRVETTYALAYEALRPRPQQPEGGVVLGNIFNM